MRCDEANTCTDIISYCISCLAVYVASLSAALPRSEHMAAMFGGLVTVVKYPRAVKQICIVTRLIAIKSGQQQNYNQQVTCL